MPHMIGVGGAGIRGLSFPSLILKIPAQFRAATKADGVCQLLTFVPCTTPLAHQLGACSNLCCQQCGLPKLVTQ